MRMYPSFNVDRVPISQEGPAVIRQSPPDGHRDKGDLLFIPVGNVPVVFLDGQAELYDSPSVNTAIDGITCDSSCQTEVIGTGHVLTINHGADSVADFLP